MHATVPANYFPSTPSTSSTRNKNQEISASLPTRTSASTSNDNQKLKLNWDDILDLNSIDFSNVDWKYQMDV
ncbi:hypothetical protein AQUCO_01200238v1 [Aquilegia coerulea]|uniref:Uncharacterized protein n=1 Tax=Aquilegia coerulea TaxID=218851 RepID=A0A2G5E528_AQUCA|nr:hypothetical protein AQUCO_01200238v1 [Aquilegia coerulea]